MLAWIVIVAAAAAGASVLHYWLRNSPRILLRHLLIGLALAFFLLPAPVPRFEGHVAPAFVVAVFELFFQLDGRPAVSLRILGLGMALVAIAIAAGHYFLRLRRPQKQ